jgi:hypothetical protein
VDLSVENAQSQVEFNANVTVLFKEASLLERLGRPAVPRGERRANPHETWDLGASSASGKY